MRERDKDDIRHQIDALLRATINQDWENLQHTHAPDWCGFALQSPVILKSRDELLAAAGNNAPAFQLRDYEMIEIAYRFFGEMCIVPYVARVRGINDNNEPFEARLQSICVYLKHQHEWQLSISDMVLVY